MIAVTSKDDIYFKYAYRLPKRYIKKKNQDMFYLCEHSCFTQTKCIYSLSM